MRWYCWGNLIYSEIAGKTLHTFTFSEGSFAGAGCIYSIVVLGGHLDCSIASACFDSGDQWPEHAGTLRSTFSHCYAVSLYGRRGYPVFDRGGGAVCLSRCGGDSIPDDGGAPVLHFIRQAKQMGVRLLLCRKPPTAGQTTLAEPVLIAEVDDYGSGGELATMILEYEKVLSL